MSSAYVRDRHKVNVVDITGPIFSGDVLDGWQQLSSAEAETVEKLEAQVDRRLEMAELVEAYARFGSDTEFKSLSPDEQKRLRNKLGEEEIQRLKGYRPGQTPTENWSDSLKVHPDRTRMLLFHLESSLTSTAKIFAESWNEEHTITHNDKKGRAEKVQAINFFSSHLMDVVKLQRDVYDLLRQSHGQVKHILWRSHDTSQVEITVFDVHTKEHTPPVLKEIETCLADTIVDWLYLSRIPGSHKLFEHPEDFAAHLKSSMETYRNNFARANSALLEGTRGKRELLSPLRLFKTLEKMMLATLWAKGDWDGDEVKTFEEKLKPLIRDLAIAKSSGHHQTAHGQ